MRILLVSFFAEKHLSSSSAQNSRFMANGLYQLGHDVRVVCASTQDGMVIQDGYQLIRVPLKSPEWSRRWFGSWRPNRKVRLFAQSFLDKWRPDVIYVGAWNGLAEFGFEAAKRSIPIVQMVHDYSILCLKQWLLDSWGDACTGPESLEKCQRCIGHGLGWKDKIRESTLKMPLIGSSVRQLLPSWQSTEVINSVLAEAYSYMAEYRNKITLFIAQSPSVVDVLASNGIDRDRIRSLPQYIGEEKLQCYPRAEGKPGIDRPIRMIYVGRWSQEKGVDVLLSAFAAIKTEVPVELWIVSRNAQQSEIDAVLKGELQNKQIHVFNDLYGADVSMKLALADVAIIPSIGMEIASRIVPEANAQGVPVIVSKLVGNRYMVDDGVNGRVLAAGDVNDLRLCLVQIASNPNVIAEWSQQVNQPIDRLNWLKQLHGIIQSTVELYQ